jgi:Na+-translocating ferredoxin:NAD+ oxidoreductase RnfG subunit
LRSRRTRLAAGALLALLLAAPAGAKVFLSRQEALREAFPGADRVETRSVVLSDAEARAVQERARSELPSRIVNLYVGVRDGAPVGYALIDVHTVRTLPEAFLVVLSPQGEVRSLRVLAFYEPGEYRPPERWLSQFDRRRLDEELRLGGAIHGIAGATLSARAVTGSVRRALALFEVLVRGDAASGLAAAPAPPPAPPAAPAGAAGTGGAR